MSSSKRIAFIALLAPPALLGLAVFTFAFFQVTKNPWTDEPFDEAATRGWMEVFQPLREGEELPNTWREWPSDTTEIQSGETTWSDEALSIFAMNNSFVVSCGLLTWIGLLAFALLEAAAPGAQSFWVGALRRAAVGGIVLVGYFLIGFGLTFPGGMYLDSFGLIPQPDFSWFLPEANLEGYIGLTLWADFFSITPLVLMMALLIGGFWSAGLRSVPGAIIAIVLGVIVFPIVASWSWGGGWISENNGVDLAGATVVHLQGGAAAVPIAIALAICRRRRARLNILHDPKTPTGSAVMRLLALICILLLAVGANLSSLLAADPLGSRVFVGLGITVGISVITAFPWGFFNRRRSALEMCAIGALAGAVYASSAAESVTMQGAAYLGLAAGVLTGFLVFMLDLLEVPDPLAVIPVHLFGGAVASFLPAVFGADGATWIGQVYLFAAAGGIAFTVSAVVTMIFMLANYFDRELRRPSENLSASSS
ncbi:MAG: hypothetical protein AAF585_11585 [Verrucomicrobiota bacterium]